MTHISHAAAALGGDVSGRDTILCPGSKFQISPRSQKRYPNGNHAGIQ